MSKTFKRYSLAISEDIMTTIKEILKRTYNLTFNAEVEYDWIRIAEIIVDSVDIETELLEQQLIDNNESVEKLLYWQDLFFMEMAEQGRVFNEDDRVLFEKIKRNQLYIDNQNFLNKLPKVTTEIGRALLIDSIIDNDDADKLIPDYLIERALKKKRREELRKQFEGWGRNVPIVAEQQEAYANRYTGLETPQETNKRKSYKFIKLLIAACFVGVVVIIGYNAFNNDLEETGSSYATTTEKLVLKEKGLSYVRGKSETYINIQIISYNDFIVDNPEEADKLMLNSYSFIDKTLKLILSNNTDDIELIELDHNKLYLNLSNDFYRIESAKNYKKLEKVNDKIIIDRLERIVFEYE